MVDRRLRWIGAVMLAALGCDSGITRDNPCDPQTSAALQRTGVLVVRFVLPEGVIEPGPITLTREGDVRAAVFTDAEQIDGRWDVTYRLDDVRPGVHHLGFAAEGLTPAAGAAALQIAVPPCSDALVLGPIELVRTTTPPAVLDVRVGEGGPFVRTASVEVAVTCVDDQTPPEAMRLQLAGDATYDGRWQPSVRVDVGDEGPKRLVATCIDGAHNASAPVEQTFTLDATAPAVPRFELDCARGGAPTHQLALTACIEVTDAGSGVDAVALSADPRLDCATATYGDAPGDVPFALAPGDGERRLYACARDRAGNATGPVASTPIVVDQTPPPAPRVILGDGGRYAQTAQVALTLEGVADDVAEVRIGGDVPAPLAVALAARPEAIELTAGEGERTVEVVVVDAAGNPSPPSRATVIVDSLPPPPGDILVAGGQGRVNTRIVPVTVSGEADFTALWTPPTDRACAATAPACGDDLFKPFAAVTTHTLPEARGEWRVCWRFCDAAGNGSVVVDAGHSLELGPYIARPQPVLSDLNPTTVTALTPSAEIVLSGEGIAADTRAHFDNFNLPCVVDGAADCQADPDGGCGVEGPCARTCARACRVSLPDAMLRRAGSYVVSLATPDPVVDGLNQSEARAIFDMVAPLPQITDLWPRGIVQPVGPEGQPLPGSVRVTVHGRGLLDNAQYRIGRNDGRVIDGPSRPNEAGERTVTVEIPNDGLLPSDLIDSEFAAVNPGPGGGVGGVPFGINPEVTACDAGQPCLSNLRATRATLPGQGTLAQAFALEGGDALSGIRVSGAQAVQVRDADGALLARFPTSAGARPLPPFVRPASTVLEHGLGQAPVVSRRPALRIGTGEFAPGVPIGAPDSLGALALADLDRDGLPELLSTVFFGNALRVWPSSREGEVEPAIYETTAGPREMAVADLDADGWPDVAVTGVSEGTVAVHFGRRDGTLDGAVIFDQGDQALGAPLLVDLNDDGRADLLSCTNQGLQWRRNAGERRFAPVAPLGQHRGWCEAVVAADMDGDHRFDLVTFEQQLGQVSIHRRLPDGQIADPVAFDAGLGGVVNFPSGVPAMALGDLDADGALDGVVVKQNAVQVLYNDGQGALAPGPELRLRGEFIEALAIADVNADGWPDVVGGNVNGVAWWRGSPGRQWGSFTPLPVTAPIAVDDWDGDGALDVVANDLWGGGLGVFRNLGRAGPGVGTPLQNEAGLGCRQRWADVDTDGHLDLVGIGFDRVLRVSFGDGDGGFRATTSFWEHESPILGDIAVADLDNDRIPDLVSYAGPTGALIIAHGVFGEPVSYEIEGQGRGRCVAVANLDADPEPEIVLGRAESFQIIDYVGDAPDVAVSTNEPMSAVVPADLDGDGDLDLLSLVEVDPALEGRIMVRLNQGDLSFSPPMAFDVRSGTNALQVADLDADGRPDLVIGTTLFAPPPGRYRVATCRGLGDGTFARCVPLAEESGEGILGLVDLNGDGAKDLVAAFDVPARLMVALSAPGEGLGPLHAVADLPTGVIPTSVDAADMDGDGVPDVALGADEPPNRLDCIRTLLWRLPAPVGVLQALTEPFEPVPVHPAAPVERAIATAGQWLDRVVVRVRLEGSAIGNATLALTAPDGTALPLAPVVGAGAAVVQVVERPDANANRALAALAGRWMPAGAWTLTVTNNGAEDFDLVDFTVVTHGQFTRAAP